MFPGDSPKNKSWKEWHVFWPFDPDTLDLYWCWWYKSPIKVMGSLDFISSRLAASIATAFKLYSRATDVSRWLPAHNSTKWRPGPMSSTSPKPERRVSQWVGLILCTHLYIYMHTPEKIMFQKFINMRLNQTFVQETDQQHRKDTSKHAVLHSYQSGQPVGSKRSLVGSIRCMAAVRAGRVDSNAGGSWAINQLEFSWVTFTGLKKKQSRTNCTATYQESCYLFFATLGVWVAWMFIHCSTPKLWPSSASGILNASYMM